MDSGNSSSDLTTELNELNSTPRNSQVHQQCSIPMLLQTPQPCILTLQVHTPTSLQCHHIPAHMTASALPPEVEGSGECSPGAQGVGVLFPWNAFITVTEYFASKLKGSDFEDSLIYCSQYNNLIHHTDRFPFSPTALIFCVTKFRMCAFAITRPSSFFNIFFLIIDVLYGNKIKTLYRVGLPLTIQLIVFAMMAAFVKADINGNKFFFVTLVLVMFAGSATAFLQGGFFSLAAVMRSRYTQAQMSGQAMGGLIVSLLNVLTLAVAGSKNNAENAAFIFFLIAVALIFVCMCHVHVAIVLHDLTSLLQSSGGASTVWTQAKEAIRQVKLPAALVLLTFAVTLSIFPGISDRIKSTTPSSLWSKRYFIPVACFVFFNLGDTVGRTVSLWVEWPGVKRYKLLTWPVIARVFFIPLFILCNVNLGSENRRRAQSIDGWRIHGKALALTVGLLMGTLINFGLKALLCMCNPFVKTT
eukprot:gene1355-4530_t